MSLHIFLLLPLGTLAYPAVSSYDAYDDASCGIYPSCHQYGEGLWEILEDCHRYVNCTRIDGEIKQQNMECPGDLVFANEYGECVEYDKATQCKVFQETPCLFSCPRVYLGSTGPALDNQERRIGCFRISGTIFGGTMVHYQNQNGQYLTPDSMSNPLSIHWLVSESPGAFNGGIKNTKFDYVRCPYDGWNQGWEVDVGGGHWAADDTMVVRCHKGDEGASTDAPPVTQTTIQPTAPPQNCHKDGANAIDECTKDFLCCHYDNSNSAWEETACSCNNDNVFIQEFNMCTWPDVCFNKDITLPGMLGMVQDYTCDGNVECPGYGD